MTDIPGRLATSLADRYRIERELGAGGMAVVYLAHDVRHDRKVALKVLRAELAAILGGERFLKEIRTTANLQHPHILPLHDSGEADGVVFYVMPYVEGESLRDRLARDKQLPVEEAVRIGREVAGALDYAHRHNVVHRDIKPENILLHDGQALVADFGIALAAARTDGASRLTETGMSLGTPQYMAPEQAMGEREVTAKADIYALGCVVYEMLAGEPPFMGPTAQAIIARVMTEQPRPLTLQRHTIPTHVEAAVFTALEKLPADRHATASAFAEALVQPGATHGVTAGRPGPGAARASAARRTRLSTAAPWAVAAVALLAGLGIGARVLPRRTPSSPVRLSIMAPTETPPIAIRLSPDGSTLAMVLGRGERLAIYTRRLSELEPRRLEGTEDAFTASWSPNGQWIAFITGNQPRRVSAAGGAPIAIPLRVAAGLTALEWADNESYIVGVDGGLARLAADGTLQVFARPDSATLEPALGLDQVLPDGRVVARSWRSPPNGPVMIIDPQTGRRDTIVDADAAWASYADGVLSWTLTDGTLYAAPFDLGATRLTTPGRPVGGIVLSVLGFLPPVTISAGGLAYAPTRPRALVRVERNGIARILLEADRTYHSPRVSPDGRRIALDFTDQQRDVWLFDVADSTLTRFGFDSAAHDPTWLPDGRGLLFAAQRGGGIGVVRRRLDASGAAESVLVRGQQQVTVHAVTRDGRTGLAVAITNNVFDLYGVALDGTGRVDTILGTRYSEGWPAMSPDGRLLAYQSDESGRMEVYVRSWPGLGNKIQVSQAGGTEAVWSRDGTELFYRSGGGAEPWLVAARIDGGPAPRVRSRQQLFSVSNYEFATPHANYDVFPDGRSFVMVRQGRPGQLSEVVYLQNVRGLLDLQARSR